MHMERAILKNMQKKNVFGRILSLAVGYLSIKWYLLFQKMLQLGFVGSYNSFTLLVKSIALLDTINLVVLLF